MTKVIPIKNSNPLRIIIFITSLFLMFSCEKNTKVTSEKPVQIDHRKYDPTGSYKTNPIDGNLIKKEINANSDISLIANKIKIEGNRKDIRKLTPPKSFTLNDPTLIKTNGLIQLPLDSSTIKTRAFDTAQLKKTKLRLNLKEGLNSQQKKGAKIATNLTKIKSKIPLLTEAKAPIYKGKAVKNIKYLDVKQGTSSSYIWDVFYDSRGQIWMGTNGGGVSVYTGDKFRHFTQEHGLSNNFVWCIEEDRDGNMWFGTNGAGISIFDGNHFFRFGLDQGLDADDINFIHEDSDGNMWIGTNLNGILKYDGKKIESINSDEGVIGNNPNSIFEDQQKRKWISTDNGISIIDKDSVLTISMENGLKSNTVNQIIEDTLGQIWIAYAEDGIDVFDGTSLTNYSTDNVLLNNNVYDLLLDSIGNVWIATYGGGVCLFDGKEFTWLNETNGMSGEHILSLENDESGNIWVGIDGDGIDIIHLNSFENLNAANGLANDYIYAICEDKNNQIWFGGENGELMIFKDDRYYLYPQINDLLDKQINKIYEDTKGDIWIATATHGVIKVSGEEATNYTQENGLISNNIMEIIEGENGILWFGSNQEGLCSFDGTYFTHYNEENGLSSNKIWTSTKDFNGNLFFGTWGQGLIKYDGSYFYHITEKEGLNGSIILSSFTDSKGRLWFGSDLHGVCMFDGSEFHYYSTKNGLSSNKIWSIIEDPISESIWIGTENGLTQLLNINSKSKSSSTSYTYNWNDGIRSIDFLRSCALLDKTGVLWWGTGKGLTKLRRSSSSNIGSTPILRLRNVSINDRYIDFTNPHDSLKSKISYSSIEKFENVPTDLILSYDNNHLTFAYSALNWFKPQGISYSYKLEGLDPSWGAPTLETHADFTNIPYGKYVFKVRARAADGKWSIPLEYPFEITPPWWHTLWARLLYAIVFFIAVWLFILQRTRRLKIRQIKLVKEIKKATQEIRDKKNEVERQKNSNLEMSKRILEQDKQLILSETANTVAHELNSPLGAIQAGAESINYIYNDLFSNVIQKCSQDQIIFGYHYAKKINKQLNKSGRELSKRGEKVKQLLLTEYNLDKEDSKELSRLINKIYNESELSDLIEFVLKQNNKIEVLEMIDLLVSFEKITATTLNATQQSSKVVESLKKALKQGRIEEEVKVNLKSSIETVIEVFQEDIQKRVLIEVKVDTNHCFNKANEYKIFQLWSNVITLILTNPQEKIQVHISSIQENGHLKIIFNVDSESDTDLFKDSVYDIIMNRQQNSIDLSRAVIKNIVQEYSGKIIVENKQGKSNFKITFPVK